MHLVVAVGMFGFHLNQQPTAKISESLWKGEKGVHGCGGRVIGLVIPRQLVHQLNARHAAEVTAYRQLISFVRFTFGKSSIERTFIRIVEVRIARRSAGSRTAVCWLRHCGHFFCDKSNTDLQTSSARRNLMKAHGHTHRSTCQRKVLHLFHSLHSVLVKLEPVRMPSATFNKAEAGRQ